jgi:hypothetical protein
MSSQMVDLRRKKARDKAREQNFTLAFAALRAPSQPAIRYLLDLIPDH